MTAGRPMWRFPYREARYLIPAVGWYEWKPMERADPATGELKPYKQPFYLRVDREGPVCFAGLMSTWKPEGGKPRLTCAILTRAPSESAAQVHDRMQVNCYAWLVPSMSLVAVQRYHLLPA